MIKLILGTTSPHRRKAFDFLNLEYEPTGSNVDEMFEGRPDNPEELVKQLAKLKAHAVAANYSGGIVIGFDSIGFYDGIILEKPKSKDEAFSRLKSLSGQSYQLHTGVHMINIGDGRELSKVVTTNVSMRNLEDNQIRKYLEEDPKFKTMAFGYDPAHPIGASFIARVEGSYTNLLWGMPLESIVEMLPHVGYNH
jgi:septum formation protein